MLKRQIVRGTAAVAVAVTMLFAGGGSATADSKSAAENAAQKAQQQAQQALENARKAIERRTRRLPAIVEAQGAVSALNPTARTFELNVSQANQAALRAKKVTMYLGTPSFVSLNGRIASLANIRVGDQGKVTGMVDPANGHVMAYLARFSRPAPAPVRVKGAVAWVLPAGGTFGLTVAPGGQTATMFVGTPSVITLNGQTATLADVRVGDGAQVTAVVEAGTGRLVVYVATFTRSAPPAPHATEVKGVVASVNPAVPSMVVTVKGRATTVLVASPALVTLNGLTVITLAEVRVNDAVVATGVVNTGGTLVAYFLAVKR
jgi:hypothetical protein